MSQATARNIDRSQSTSSTHTAKVLTYRVLTSSPLADTVNLSHADTIVNYIDKLLTGYGPLLTAESRTLSLYGLPLYCKSTMARIRRHMGEMNASLPPRPSEYAGDVEDGTGEATEGTGSSTVATSTPDPPPSNCLPGALLYAGLCHIMSNKAIQRYSGLISRIELLDGLTPVQETELYSMRTLFRPQPGNDLTTGTGNISLRVHLALYEYSQECSGQIGVSMSTLCGPALLHGISQAPGVNTAIREECGKASERFVTSMHSRCDRLEDTLHGMGY